MLQAPWPCWWISTNVTARAFRLLLCFIDCVGEAESIGGAGSPMNSTGYAVVGSTHVFWDLGWSDESSLAIGD